MSSLTAEPRRLEARHGGASAASATDLGVGGCVSVTLGQSDPYRAIGLEVTLRKDRRLSVFAGELEDSAFIRAIARREPHVAILDRSFAQSIVPRSIDPSDGVVVLARAPTLPYGILLLAAGVSCLAYPVSPEVLLQAVHNAARGGCMFVAGAGNRIMVDDLREPVLTDREVEVLAALSVGRAYQPIAQDLDISRDTVKTHVRNLLRKLHATSKQDLLGLPVQWLTWRPR